MFDTITHLKKRCFLVAYSEYPNVKEAAILADISRELHYDWLAKDTDYRDAFALAKEMAADVLEDEIARRTLKSAAGSDKLLLGTLAALRPEKWGTKRVKNEHTGPGGGPLQVIDWAQFSDDELRQLERFASRRVAPPRLDPGGAGAEEAEQVFLAVPGDGTAAA